MGIYLVDNSFTHSLLISEFLDTGKKIVIAINYPCLNTWLCIGFLLWRNVNLSPRLICIVRVKTDLAMIESISDPNGAPVGDLDS